MAKRQDAGTSAGRPGARTNLAEQVAGRLRGRLTSGELRPGDRLPTEHELGRANGVSRTVVREAIAALRADGLVVARQGSGVFVAEPPDPGLRFGMLAFDPEKLSSIIETLELRAAVESEAAALAAERCSPGELANIRERHQAMAEAVAAGGRAEAQDHDFHLAIAESTHNRLFVEFFRFLGARTIPRAQAADSQSGGINPAYLRLILDEHRRIAEAIARRDGPAAHAAMRAHLKQSQARYQALAETV